MRVFIYEILTQLIIALAVLRKKVTSNKGYRVLKYRTIKEELPDGGYTILEECCDCGLTHSVSRKGKSLFVQPLRPEGYKYGLRFLAGQSSELRNGIVEWER